MFKKKKEPNPHEILPFCMRCFNIGIGANQEVNYCHVCGGGFTCTPIQRKDVEYLQENIKAQIDSAVKSARKKARSEIVHQIHLMDEDK